MPDDKKRGQKKKLNYAGQLSSDYIAIEGQRNVNRRTASQQIANEKLSIWSLVVEHEATACVAVFLRPPTKTDWAIDSIAYKAQRMNKK